MDKSNQDYSDSDIFYAALIASLQGVDPNFLKNLAENAEHLLAN